MSKAEHHPVFSDWHPHFTPEWLSKRLATHLPKSFHGSVIDPACGSGNLLAAAAVRLNGAARKREAMEFLGADVSIRAVRACRETLSHLLPNRNFQIVQANFLTAKNSLQARSDAVSILMNPPFRGYGELARTTRRRIIRHLHMKGRFNLSYAFVRHAVNLFHPQILVSLLPSNWIYSRGSAFRAELDTLAGKWDWEDIGNEAFAGIDVHVGILIWQPKGRPNQNTTTTKTSKKKVPTNLEVRQGVATGCDEIFCQLSGLEIPFGRSVLAIRGRDVDRKSSATMWLPPRKIGEAMTHQFTGVVPQNMLRALRKRSCVANGGRNIFEFHESFPAWFSEKPKLLLPEIATGPLRVELDARGRKLPLHSVIAIQVPSLSAGRKLKRYLQDPRRQRTLRATAPRLSGKSIRLQVGTVRQMVTRWKRGKKARRKL